MRIYGKSNLLRKTFFSLAFTCCVWCLVTEVKADSWGGSWGGGSGGSWGGSRGGFGSGGGLLGGRRPIRNLLGRIGDHFGGHRGGSYGGSSGGSTGFASGGSVGHSYASGGSYGSAGSGFGSMGSSNGSVGSSYGSMGSSYGSVGSSYGSMGSSYGSVGSSYGSVGSYYGAMGGTSYGSVGSSYVSTASMDSVGMIGSALPIESYGSYSAPISNGGVIYDSGFSPAVPGVYDSTISAPSTAPVTDGIQPVPGIYYEGGNGSSTAPTEAPSGGSGGSGSDFSPPPTPTSGTDDGSTSIVPNRRATVLNLRVPNDAKVYINDHQTKTQGDVRRYVSRNLESGREYYYHVKAVVVRNGKEIERNELVSLRAGEAEAIEFDFERSVTSLALKVPANAKVTLCGKKTNASGDSRHFSTTKLEPGQVWEDYTVEVALESNGKVIRQEKKIKMVGGESYQLTFEFDATKELLAVR